MEMIKLGMYKSLLFSGRISPTAAFAGRFLQRRWPQGAQVNEKTGHIGLVGPIDCSVSGCFLGCIAHYGVCHRTGFV